MSFMKFKYHSYLGWHGMQPQQSDGITKEKKKTLQKAYFPGMNLRENNILGGRKSKYEDR